MDILAIYLSAFFAIFCHYRWKDIVLGENERLEIPNVTLYGIVDTSVLSIDGFDDIPETRRNVIP